MRVLATLAALVAFSAAASALPPPGTDLNSPVHQWWECNKQPGQGQFRASCCTQADGRVLADEDWRAQQDSSKLATYPYQVRVEGRWFDVQRTAVISGDNGCGPDPNPATASAAKVWYSLYRGTDGKIESLSIYCFLAGVFG